MFELLFGAVRGSKIDPTTIRHHGNYHHENIYKKLLLRNEVTSSNGNCENWNDISILFSTDYCKVIL